jgi:glycosyltransferase involved in cell wall biosynthesis
MAESVKFSVIIPTYNRAHTLRKAIDSVLTQTYPHFEIWVIDDGSTDHTPELLKSYSDPRLHTVFQQNAGVCAARNHGARLSQNEWLVFLDSDDWVGIDWLGNFAGVICGDSPDIVFCSIEKFKHTSGKSEVVDARDPYKSGQKAGGLFLSGAFALKKSLFIDVGLYDENIRFSENTELSFRLKERNLKKGFTDKVGLYYQPPADGGSRNLQNSLTSNLYILEKHKVYFTQNPRVKQLYLQTVGVAQIRLGDFSGGRKNLWKAFFAYPSKPKSLLRALAGTIPFIAAKIWPGSIENVR